MKNEDKYIDEIDALINEPLKMEYEPSICFVDDVMAQIEKTEKSRPISKILQFSFSAAASVAIVFFLTNLYVILSYSGSDSSAVADDWSGIYEQSNTANWYDYYSDEIFVANNDSK